MNQCGLIYVENYCNSYSPTGSVLSPFPPPLSSDLPFDPYVPYDYSAVTSAVGVSLDKSTPIQPPARPSTRRMSAEWKKTMLRIYNQRERDWTCSEFHQAVRSAIPDNSRTDLQIKRWFYTRRRLQKTRGGRSQKEHLEASKLCEVKPDRMPPPTSSVLLDSDVEYRVPQTPRTAIPAPAFHSTASCPTGEPPAPQPAPAAEPANASAALALQTEKEQMAALSREKGSAMLASFLDATLFEAGPEESRSSGDRVVP